MTDGPRLDSLIIGLLLAVCLVGGVYVSLRFNIGGVRNSPPQTTDSLSTGPIPVPPVAARRRRKIPRGDSSPSKATPLATSPTATDEWAAQEKSGSVSTSLPTKVSAQNVVTSEPDRKTLKPLGYVQKANGQVEAIVSEGEGVQVVHVGDVYEDKYTVAQISPQGVEMVASSRPTNVSSPTSTVVSNANIVNGSDSEAWAYSSPLTHRARASGRRQDQVAALREKSERVEKKQSGIPRGETPTSTPQPDNRQVALAGPASAPPKPLGYVEKSDGTRLAVVPDGESVRLVTPGNTLAAQSAIKNATPAIESARLAEPAVPKPVAANLNRKNAVSAHSNHSPEPTRTLITTSARTVGSQQMTSGIPSAQSSDASQPLVLSRTLGFVQKADGNVQAIVEQGDEIRLARVPETSQETLLAGGDTPKGSPLADDLPARVTSPPEPVAGLVSHNGHTPDILTGGRRASTFDPTQAANPLAAKEMEAAGLLRPTEPPDKPPPEPQATIAADQAISDKPPPDEAAIEATLGLEAEAAGSSDRSDAILRSFGYLNPQRDRASPEAASFEAGAPPTGPPESDATVLRSFGYEEWQYGRASPITASLGLKRGAGGSSERNPTLLKPIGYLQWSDGRAFAVIDDGEGGVRLVHEGEILDNRFKVVKVGPDSVEITQLPLSSSTSGPNFAPFAHEAGATELPLPDPWKRSAQSTGVVRLKGKELAPTQEISGSLNKIKRFRITKPLSHAPPGPKDSGAKDTGNRSVAPQDSPTTTVKTGSASVPVQGAIPSPGSALLGSSAPLVNPISRFVSNAAPPGIRVSSASNMPVPAGQAFAFPATSLPTWPGTFANRA